MEFPIFKLENDRIIRIIMLFIMRINLHVPYMMRNHEFANTNKSNVLTREMINNISITHTLFPLPKCGRRLRNKLASPEVFIHVT